MICFPVLASVTLDVLKEEQNLVQAEFSPCPLLLCEISVSSSSSQGISFHLDQDCPPSGPISMSSLECSTKQRTPLLTLTEYISLGVLHRHLKFNIPNWAYHFSPLQKCSSYVSHVGHWHDMPNSQRENSESSFRGFNPEFRILLCPEAILIHSLCVTVLVQVSLISMEDHNKSPLASPPQPLPTIESILHPILECLS